jgi:hypothetical protein
MPLTHRPAIDLTVTLDRDEPGTLARATEAIAGAGINIDACAEVDGIFHLVASDAAAARQALMQAGFRLTGEQDVLLVDAVNQPGTVASIFRRIADAGVNVRFAYLGARDRLVLGVDDVHAATDALQDRSVR